MNKRQKSALFFMPLICLLGLTQTAAHAQDATFATENDREEKFTQDIPVSYVIHEGFIWTPTTERLLLSWPEADNYCRTTIIHGMKGWRLPTTDELNALYKSQEMNNKGWLLNRVWSSTAHRLGGHMSVGLKLGFTNWTNDNLKLLTTCIYKFKQH